MRYASRLNKLETLADKRFPADLFHIVVARTAAEEPDRPPGLHRSGPPGSLAGVFVYDPAAGPPDVPEERLAPWAHVIMVHPEG